METQFNNVLAPDPTVKYQCCEGDMCTASGFTHLMKLVLVINKFPNADGLITDILVNSPEQINKHNSRGWTALMLACVNVPKYCNIKTVELLLQNGADVNCTDDSNTTSLMYSVGTNSRYSVDVAKLLILYKADINAVDNMLCTPLMYACNCYQSCNGNIESVALLIKNKADINMKDIYGASALTHACSNLDLDNSTKKIELLLNNNSNAKTLNLLGRTPLINFCMSFSYNLEFMKTAESVATFLKLINETGEYVTKRDALNNTAYDYYMNHNSNVLNNEQILKLRR